MSKLKNQLIDIENTIKKSIEKKQRKDENAAIEKIKSNSKAFYSYARIKSKCNEEIGPLLDSNGNVTTDQKQMANILLHQYGSMFSVPVSEVPFIESFHRSNFKDMDDFYITESDVKIVLKRLKGSASPGPDGVYGWCYKRGGKFILDCLIDCMNQSLDEMKASGNTREAWISPTWRGENKTVGLKL